MYQKGRPGTLLKWATSSFLDFYFFLFYFQKLKQKKELTGILQIMDQALIWQAANLGSERLSDLDSGECVWWGGVGGAS